MSKTQSLASVQSLNQPLFKEQLGTATVPSEFVSPTLLAERFRACPDPLLTQFGGNRVEVAIGLGRDVYQLEVSAPTETNASVTARWTKAGTHARRVKEGVPIALNNKVPVTLDAAITSLCATFGLCRETVIKAGVNLMAFWESNDAGQQLELPMSTDWNRYSLVKL
jgi:hypothetical protein